MNLDEEFKKALRKQVDTIIKSSISKHGNFHNNHEMWAVLKEEIEEAKDEMNDIEISFESMWFRIKTDSDIEEQLDKIIKCAKNSINELIDVLAVCNKELYSNHMCIVCGSRKEIKEIQGFKYCKECAKNPIL